MSSNFVIFAEARTGGTHLISKLNSHPNCRAVSEPFPHLNIEKNFPDQKNWCESFFEERNGDSIISGFRTKISHLSDTDKFVEYFKSKNLSIIFLERNNLIKRAISRVRAKELYNVYGDYNLKAKKGNTPLPPIDISPNALTKELKICEEEVKNTQDLLEKFVGYEILNLSYEDLLKDEKQFMKMVNSFIGLKDVELNSEVFKNTSDDLRESVKNFDELKNFFAKESKYLVMFNS